MIEFSSEWVRTEFHLLPVDTQMEFYTLATRYAETGHIITIGCIEKWGPKDSNLEVSIRIDKKFDPVTPASDTNSTGTEHKI